MYWSISVVSRGLKDGVEVEAEVEMISGWPEDEAIAEAASRVEQYAIAQSCRKSEVSGYPVVTLTVCWRGVCSPSKVLPDKAPCRHDIDTRGPGRR